jgi:hypothetical protein
MPLGKTQSKDGFMFINPSSKGIAIQEGGLFFFSGREYSMIVNADQWYDLAISSLEGITYEAIKGNRLLDKMFRAVFNKELRQFMEVQQFKINDNHIEG